MVGGSRALPPETVNAGDIPIFVLAVITIRSSGSSMLPLAEEVRPNRHDLLCAPATFADF